MPPLLLFWLRMLANLMLAFGTLVAVVNPPQVFFPVSWGLVTLMACAGVLWLLTIQSWFRGFARIFELGGVAGVAVLALFAVTRLHAVQERWVISAMLGEAPDLGLVNLTSYFSPEYGPRLVRSAHAMEGRCGYKLTGVSPIEGRGDYAFCYASLRLRGKSDRQIVAEQEKGPAMFLGTLAAESFEPYWWRSADWLRKELPLHPASGWKMGLLPPEWARATFQQLIARTPIDPDLLESMLFLSLQRFDIATPEQRQSLLTAWAAQRTKSGFPIDASLAFRQKLADALANRTRGGQVQVSFNYPDTWSQESRDSYTQELQMFFRSAGLDARTSSEGYPIRVSAAFREWDKVTYTFRDDVKRQVDEYHPGVAFRVGSVTTSTLPSTTHREVYDRVSKQEQGKLGVPTVMLEIGGASLMLPPSSLVSRELAYSLGDCDPQRAKPGSERQIYESLLAQLTLDPWRLGLYWPNSLDDSSKRDQEFIPRQESN